MTDSNASQPRNSKYLWLAALMAFLSLFVHGYLYMQHLALQSGEYTKSICDINEKFDCSAVSASKYAVLFGIPVALWGFMANVVFLVLVAVVLPLTDKKTAGRRNVLLCAIGIFAASIVMGSISTFMLSKLCAFCMTAYLLSILMLLFAWLGIRSPQSVFANMSLKDFTPLITLIAVAFVGAYIANSSVAQGADVNSTENKATFDGFIQEWKSAPAKDFTLVDPLSTGPANAKMVIQEFADFRCIHCKHAAPILHAFVASHPDARLEFQPWPLDGECNTAVGQTNGASCLLARTSWCAQKNKQTGWGVHDYIYGLAEIYASADAVKADLANLAKAASMTLTEMQTCTDSDEAKAVVRHQAEVGTNLNIQGTPTIYVNKKQLSGAQALPVLERAYNSL